MVHAAISLRSARPGRSKFVSPLLVNTYCVLSDMIEDLIDDLLYRSEASDLEFKAEQYVLSGGSNDAKSELVKDILAMANAWREGTGYILLGVKENKPHPPIVVGISTFYDDAHFQQLVNSKLTPKVEFKYEVFPYHGKAVGLITIPKQPRPFFLQKDWGRLAASIVYVRRGSSTAIALPDEIAKMGADNEQAHQKPRVRPHFLLAKGNSSLVGPQTVNNLEFGNIDELPDFLYSNASYPYPSPLDNILTNRSYWRDFAKYLQAHSASINIKIYLENNSEFALSDCKLEIAILSHDCDHPAIRLGRRLPDRPSKNMALNPTLTPLVNQALREKPSLSMEETFGQRRYVARFPRILPGETASIKEILAIFPQNSGRLDISSRLLATELSSPLKFHESIEVVVEHENISIDDLVRIDAGTSTDQ